MLFNDKQIQIITAAEKLIADHGFEGTSVRDIADAAHVNLAMISYYFGSKEKLMEAVFAYRSASFKLELENMIRNEELGPMEKVESLIDQYINKLMNQQCFHRVMVREQKKTNQELIAQLIQEGQKKGIFKKHVDIPLMMATLVGTVSHLITTQHYYKEINGLQDMQAEEFNQHIRKKLSQHLKKIFKAILTHEA